MFRIKVKNRPGVLAQIASVFGVHMVSITRMIQNEIDEDYAELVMVTERVKESQMEDALEHLKNMRAIIEISSVIREY